MNERIRELVTEAAEYCDENRTRGIMASDAFNQKFAELIIKECAYVWLMNPQLHPNLLLEHFGINEFNDDSLHHHGKVLTGEFRHFCPEFDYLPIDETAFEFQFCDCYCITWNMNKKRKMIEEMRNEGSN